MKNKKAQINAIIVFAAVIIILLFLAPIILKIVVAPVSKVATAFSTVDPTNQSTQQITFIQNKFTGTFDWVIAFFFMFNTIILLLSAFLVDVHPAFLVIYIIAAFFLMVFAPTVLSALGNIYESPSFSVGNENVIQYIPITNFIYQNFGFILVGIIILSGVILFAKYKLGNSYSGGSSY